MKRYAALLLITVLVGCGGGGSPTPSGPSGPGAPGATPKPGTTATPGATAPPGSQETATPTTPVPEGAEPSVGGCQIFPSNNPWNTNISNATQYPDDPMSSTYINTILNDGSGQTNLHPDFGETATYGIPFVVVPQSQPTVPVSFVYSDQSDPGPYPVPPNAPIEGGSGASAGSDRHVLVLEQGACSLYEMYQGTPVNNGASWTATSGALFNLNSNALRPEGWTSADAAGLPILPALVKCAEVQAGAINHALRVTFNSTQNGWVSPATHEAGVANVDLPPMGERMRLKSSYSISGFTGQSKIVLTAMQQYGLFVADNGSDWYFQGEGTGNNGSSCWNDDDLDQMKSVPGSAFEFVETGPIQYSASTLRRK